MAVVELIAPVEVLRALQDGKRQGQWIRSYCPYCSPGRVRHGDRPLAACMTGFGRNKDKPGWLCHRCHAEEQYRGPDALADMPKRKYEFDPSKQQRSDDDRREAAKRILESCSHIEDGDPVDLYLRVTRRLKPLTATWPSSLRRTRLTHPDARNGKKYTCMVAAVTDLQGNVYGIHRTYLTEDGQKANVSNPRLSLGPINGHAVRLGVDSSKIVIAEGIETTLAAMEKYKRVGLSALFAKGLAAQQIPPSATDVLIAADWDWRPSKPREHLIGLRCARELRDRINQEAVDKQRHIKVQIVRPPNNRKDFADLG
jgi:hypothetical protein